MKDEGTRPSESIKAIPLDEARRMRGESLVAVPRNKVAALRAFRRVRADRVFGVVGIVFLIIGTILVFSWPPPPVPVDKKFGVEWPEQRYDLGTQDGDLRVPASQPGQPTPQPTKPYEFNVNRTNVTQISFWVAWRDDVAGGGEDQLEGDTFEVELEPPKTTNLSTIKIRATGGKAGANISFAIPLSGIPDLPSVAATNEAEARAAVGDRTNTTGTGIWKLTVRLLAAKSDWKVNETRDTGAPCAEPACTPDSGNTYQVHFDYDVYTLRLKKQF